MEFIVRRSRLEERFVEVEAVARFDMHRAGQRTFGHGRRRAFVDVDGLDDGGRQFAQVGRAATAGVDAIRQRAAGVEDGHAVDVDAGGLHAVAAHRNALALAIVAAIERDARHA